MGICTSTGLHLFSSWNCFGQQTAERMADVQTAIIETIFYHDSRWCRRDHEMKRHDPQNGPKCLFFNVDICVLRHAEFLTGFSEQPWFCLVEDIKLEQGYERPSTRRLIELWTEITDELLLCCLSACQEGCFKRYCHIVDEFLVASTE